MSVLTDRLVYRNTQRLRVTCVRAAGPTQLVRNPAH